MGIVSNRYYFQIADEPDTTEGLTLVWLQACFHLIPVCGGSRCFLQHLFDSLGGATDSTDDGPA